MSEVDCIVLGGGLAGITSALRLADAGREVALLEGRPRLGGAAFSFSRGGLSIDNGQHVFLRCCESYRWLLERLGVADQVILQDRLDIPVLRADGRSARLSRLPGVPAPAHLTGALAGYGLLSPTDRVRAVRGALALRRLDPSDTALDTQSLGGFLRRHGQNDATIEALWGIVATATLNLSPDEASLALAAKVFRTGLLDHAPAADIGYAAVPLGELHSTAALRALAAAGVEVLLGQRIEEVRGDRDGGVVVHSTGAAGRTGSRTWHAGGAVLALPHRDALACTPELATTSAGRAEGLGATPIVNVHVVYDRTVTDLPFAAAVGSPVQWFFDRTATSGLRRGQYRQGQYLAITVSAADDIIDTPSRVLRDLFVGELARLLPRAGRAEVVDAFVTRERRATFRQAVGSASLRPGCRSGVDGIWLAGAWTATGWPDTMESAVLSGINATDDVLGVRPSRSRVAA
ncbi:MAG TPA: hydroxysqualene dehydroxylase HpnE [Jatrophihabitantaceae bacterium]|jgi:squalene-associated FAD-dependent desaturase|nr:hydroxysqualene dehydroxylase HpnE [Jatrophihabitantaceae bacterium]